MIFTVTDARFVERVGGPQHFKGTEAAHDPARRGPVVGVGRVVRRGRHVAFAEGEVTDGEGQIVARAHGTWVIWPGHPDGEATSS